MGGGHCCIVTASAGASWRASARGITAITGGGAIADVADYQVRQDPDGTFVGTLNEDFAVEANVGDIFQLGNTSWRILKVERGTVRVADAQGPAAVDPVLARRRAVAHGRTVGRDRRACAKISRRSARCFSARSSFRPRRRCKSRNTSPTASACSAPCRRKNASSSNASSTNPAACRWSCMHRSADGSTAPGDWRCESILPRLWFRATSRRQRRGDRHLARPAAQLSAGGCFQLPASEHGRESAHAGGARSADVRIALAMERDALAGAGALPERRARAAADHAHARRRSARRQHFPRPSRARKICPPAICRSRWSIRWSGRRSKIA